MIAGFIYFWRKQGDKDPSTETIEKPKEINEDEDRFCLSNDTNVDTKEMTKFRPSVIQNTETNEDLNL